MSRIQEIKNDNGRTPTQKHLKHDIKLVTKSKVSKSSILERNDPPPTLTSEIYCCRLEHVSCQTNMLSALLYLTSLHQFTVHIKLT